MPSLHVLAERLQTNYGDEARVRICSPALRVALGNLDEVVFLKTLVIALEFEDIEGEGYSLSFTVKNWHVLDADDNMVIEPEIVDKSPNQVSIMRSMMGMTTVGDDITHEDGEIKIGGARLAVKAWNGERSTWIAIVDEFPAVAPFTQSDLHGLLAGIPAKTHDDPGAVIRLIQERLCG